MSYNRLPKFQNINISLMTFVKLALLIFGIWFLWFIRDIVAIVFVSLLLAALIDPFADWFQKHSIPRGLAVIIVYIVLGAIVSLIFVLLVPVVIEQMIQLLGNLAGWYGELASKFGQVQTFSIEYGFAENLKSSLESIQSAISNSFSSLFSTLRGFISGVAALFIVLVLSFYMVNEEDVARKYFKHLAPAEYRPFISQLIVKMQKKIGEWLRAQLILGVIVGSAVYIILTLLGVKYALILALMAGVLEIIPYVGPVLSTIPAVIIGFAQSMVTGFVVLFVYLIVQQIENNILVPKIMQKVTGLNPIISIVALMVGIKIGGLVGAILAIPVATMLAVVLEELFEEYSISNK
ncbi:MAG: AI-2E family transporter [Patescibacteria group bacterium]